MMTCEQCELLLADGGGNAGLEEHLRGCAECRALAEELDANSLALSELRDEALGPVTPLRVPRRGSVFPWMSAAAAAALLVLVAHQVSQWRPIPETPPRPRVSTEPVTVTAKAEAPPVQATGKPFAQRKPRRVASVPGSAPSEALMVKMFTPDPDVVVYWLIESKESSE